MLVLFDVLWENISGNKMEKNGISSINRTLVDFVGYVLSDLFLWHGQQLRGENRFSIMESKNYFSFRKME